MRLQELQNEINHLLFLYYTSIGSIQRDAMDPGVEQSMEDLATEFIRCKERIDGCLDDGEDLPAMPDDFQRVIEEGKAFMSDGLCFIDEILKMSE